MGHSKTLEDMLLLPNLSSMAKNVQQSSPQTQVEVTHWEKAFATKADDLKLISGTPLGGRKESISRPPPRFCSQTTTCVLWYVYTHTYFTHIKIPTGTLSQKAAVLRAIGLGNQSEERWPMRARLSYFFPTNLGLCHMSDWVPSKSPRTTLRRCSTNLRHITHNK